MSDCSRRAFDLPDRDWVAAHADKVAMPMAMERVLDSRGATVAWVIDGERFVRARERDWDEVDCG